ncbi:MAG: methionine adenosyltransferase [Planctomycetes bacterium RBG_13_44_8b]|nr:MAG: methionine adenosyltransferase [Planctomycetes bacterium RBG_13_44_8b]
MAKKRNHNNLNCNSDNYLFTSESVTMGHPDKVADHISDAILDAHIEQDPFCRVACETLVKTGMVMVAGEITSTAVVDVPSVVRQVIKEIGYTDPAMGFDYDNCAVLVGIGRQSPDISQGVTEGKGLHKEQGAGDQGIMFGYACRETSQLMPMPIQLAQLLVARLAKVRQSGKLPWLRPDGKSQVTVEYRNGKPHRIHTVVIASQHSPDISYAKLRSGIIKNVILPVLPKRMVDKNIVYHINPTGRFVIGGPKGDCGLTGRKIIVDTYGGRGCHGGGAFSGKDPSKVDRSASYMARYIAKNVVASGLADVCEIQLSYAIGVAEPISVHIDTEGTAKVSERDLERAVREVFPLTPKGIINHLKLRRPIYAETSYHGHFGRTGANFTWEKTDMTAKLRRALGVKTSK